MDRKFGNYILHERVGIGGMGEVFRATKQGPDGFKVQVALKIILPHLADEGTFRDRFSREAGLAASLQHPNIVPVTGFDILRETPLKETPFIEMKYVPGADLRRVLRALDPGEKLSIEESAVILYSVASGLAHAHRHMEAGKKGIIHCDLNPHNILISHLGEVKITDFGIARAMQGDASASATVRGKLAYMSPEQMEGRELDHRTDLFSFGILAYQLLSGSHPFDRGSEGATITALGRADHIPLGEAAPDLPKALHDLVDTLLSLDPETRPRSAVSSMETLETMVSPAAVTSLANRIGTLGHDTSPIADITRNGGATSATLPHKGIPRSWPYLAVGLILLSMVAVVSLVPTGLEPERSAAVVPVPAKPPPKASAAAENEPLSPDRRITVRSEPPAAHIFADGNYIATAPAVITDEILRSAQRLEARLYGYHTEVFKTPPEGSDQYVVTLAPLPTGTVRISARPWAIVTFRGEDKGETPVTIPAVPVGSRAFSLANGPMNMEKRVVVKVGTGMNTVTVDMRERR